MTEEIEEIRTILGELNRIKRVVEAVRPALEYIDRRLALAERNGKILQLKLYYGEEENEN